VVLGAVQVLEGHRPRVGGEAELRQDVDVVRVERDQPLGAGRAVLVEADDADAHDRVRRARLRVALPLDLVAHRQEVDDGEGRHARLVELQVRDLPRVGRPDVALAGARRQLLLVDPVELAVQQRVRAVLREPHDARALDLHEVEVALADERHEAPVG
jgi:hypothetical protein